MRRRLPVDRLRDLPAGRGLTAAEARARRESYGTNDIAEVAPHPWWDLVRDTARDPMIWFLVGTGGLYALLGDRIEAVTLFAAIVPAGRDGRSPPSSRPRLHRGAAEPPGRAGHGRARRPGHRDPGALEIVPGDLALVSAGEPFPADGLVVAGDELQADESALTGEAYPVRKRSLTELPSRRGRAGDRRRALGLRRHATADWRAPASAWSSREARRSTARSSARRRAERRRARRYRPPSRASSVLLVIAAAVVCVDPGDGALPPGLRLARRAA